MRTSSRVLRMLGAAGLLISLLAATIVPAAAQNNGLDQDFLDDLIDSGTPGFLIGNNAIYYPWVANDDDFGLGPADTSISIQNLENNSTTISIYVGNGSGGFDLATSAYLAPYASKTFTAGQLGIAPGEGAPVRVVSFNEFSITGFPAAAGVPAAALAGLPDNTIALVETPILLSNPITADADGGTTTQVFACVVNYHTTSQPNLGHPWGYVNAQTGEWVSYSTQQELQDALNAANADDPDELVNPFGGLNNDGDCFDVLEAVTETFNNGVAIGGVAKQAVSGASLPNTTGADTSVSGYTAINGIEMGRFDQWYLPIVQTNGGPGGKWNSIIRVGNLESTNNAVTVRFFPADDGSGSLQTGFQVQELVHGGATWNIDLSAYVPADWVGSAHIYSDGAVFAMVDRYKAGTGMWITNTGSSADFERSQVPGANGRYALFAPHVLLDYFGWNTGINVANLANADNNVSIQYFNMLGNATEVLNQRLAPHGMTYFYDPSVPAQDNNRQDVTSDPNAGVVGSAIIWSQHPVAAAVDGVKYAETDPNGGADVGHATSYSATANVFPWQAVALVQKGSPADGMGDTSGINIMNPNAVAATVNVYWYNPSGFAGSNFGTSSVTIPAFANGFVYTMWQHNLPNGFTGSAQLVSTVPVAAVSANVNYQVDGDGAAIFNAFNPCGLYRVGGPCSFGDPLAPGGQSVTKYFVDEDGSPVSGVNFTIRSTSGANYQRDGVTGPNGSAIFTNVPVGVYELTVNSVPAGYILPVGVQETFVVREGVDLVLENTLLWNQGFLKTVVVDGTLDDDGEIDDETITLAGVNVTVYRNIGSTTGGTPVAGAQVFTGLTNADGQVGGSLAPGNYILCTWDANSSATTSNGETVTPALATTGAFGAVDAFCEPFTVTAGELEELINPVEIATGMFNIFVGADIDGTNATLAQVNAGVAGVEICLNGTTDCEITDASGVAEFTALAAGSHSVTVQADGLIVDDATGGLLTVVVTGVSEDGVPVTPAEIDFTYDPTDDLAQDGWLNDVDSDGNLRGSNDLEILTEPSEAEFLTKRVLGTDGQPLEGATVTVTGDGVDESEPTNADGEVTFILDPGTYVLCSTVDVNGTDYELCEDVIIDGTDPGQVVVNDHTLADLTVTTAAGAWVQVVEGTCAVADGTFDSTNAVFTGGTGEAEFAGLIPDGYCIEVYDAAEDFVVNQSITLVAGANEATLDIPNTHGVLAVTNYVMCDATVQDRQANPEAYEHYQIDAGTPVGDPTTGVPVNARGSASVCGNGIVILAEVVVRDSNSLPLPGITLVARANLDDDGHAYLLLPVDKYTLATNYLVSASGVGPFEQYYANNTTWTDLESIIVDADGTTLTWLLRLWGVA